MSRRDVWKTRTSGQLEVGVVAAGVDRCCTAANAALGLVRGFAGSG